MKSMSLYGLLDSVPEYYMIIIINSRFMSYYVDNFVNNTQTFQINDARQLPVIVPTKRMLEKIKPLFDRAIKLKKVVANGSATEEQISFELNQVEDALNRYVNELYAI